MKIIKRGAAATAAGLEHASANAFALQRRG